MIAYLLMVAILLMVSGGQTLLKKGIQSGKERGRSRLVSLFHPYVLLAGVLAAISPFLYIRVVAMLGLSSAFGLNALGYPLIFLLSWIFLKERSNPWHWTGLILISAGVFTWSL